MRYNRQRGQVLPLWSLGTIATFTLAFLAINYANAVRFQIRAQNAADSAAQALVAIQAERFNLTSEMLYASNVEEYRTRKLLDAMLLSINNTGGCDLRGSNQTYVYVYGVGIDQSNGPETCEYNYQKLRPQFLRAVNRYTADVGYLNDISSENTFTNWQNDATTMLSALTANCGSPAQIAAHLATTGDCAFTYTAISSRRRTGLAAVQSDAGGNYVPGLGSVESNATVVSAGTDSENPNIFAPVEVDVTTCAKIPPIIPNFGPFHLAPTYAIGRAAAANVMIEEDWLQPGAIFNPAIGTGSSAYFQNAEQSATPSGVDAGNYSAYDWYGVNFGGNDSASYFPQTLGFYSGRSTDELSAFVGWWNAIPEHPFGGNVQTSTVCPH